MKFIEMRKSAKDKDVEVPVFMISPAELKVIYALVKQARVYLPSLLTPDMGRINSLIKTLEQYLKQGPKAHPRSRDSGELAKGND